MSVVLSEGTAAGSLFPYANDCGPGILLFFLSRIHTMKVHTQKEKTENYGFEIKG